MSTPQTKAAFVYVALKDTEVQDKQGMAKRYHAVLPSGKEKEEGRAACDPRIPIPTKKSWMLSSQVDPGLFCRRPGCWNHLRTAARRP